MFAKLSLIESVTDWSNKLAFSLIWTTLNAPLLNRLRKESILKAEESA
jgi:hypothetical protein